MKKMKFKCGDPNRNRAELRQGVCYTRNTQSEILACLNTWLTINTQYTTRWWFVPKLFFRVFFSNLTLKLKSCFYSQIMFTVKPKMAFLMKITKMITRVNLWIFTNSPYIWFSQFSWKWLLRLWFFIKNDNLKA